MWPSCARDGTAVRCWVPCAYPCSYARLPLIRSASRFQHIETVTLDALRNLHTAEQLATCLTQLQLLDDQVATLCIQTAASPGKKPDYENPSLETGKRLISARQARTKHLQGVLQKRRAEEADLQEAFAAEEDIGLGLA
jgi:hypothetical protein